MTKYEYIYNVINHKKAAFLIFCHKISNKMSEGLRRQTECNIGRTKNLPT